MSALPNLDPSPETPPSPTVASAPLHPVWESLRREYLSRRAPFVGDDGERYPITTVGDVRKILARLSAALAGPRFDQAQLADTRRAWRAAVAHHTDAMRGRGWYHVHPDNAAVWADTRALAVALGAVDQRRDAIHTIDGRPVLTIAYADPAVLLDDLRYWYLLRRLVRRDPISLLTYPEVTAADLAHVAHLLVTATGRAPALLELEQATAATASILATDAPHPDACGFWCHAARRAVADAKRGDHG